MPGLLNIDWCEESGVPRSECVGCRTRKILERARALYASDPSHAPFGRYTVQCPAVCIQRVGGDRTHERALAEAAGLDTERFRMRRALIEWNAAASTAEVLAAFDRAIKLAEPSGDRPTPEDAGLPLAGGCSGRRLRESSIVADHAPASAIRAAAR